MRVEFTPTQIRSVYNVKAELKKDGDTCVVNLEIILNVSQASYINFQGPIVANIDHTKLAWRLQELAGMRLGKNKERELIEALEQSVPEQLEIEFD